MMTEKIFGNPEAAVTLIQPVDEHDLAGMETELAEIRKRMDRDFCLIALPVEHWNDDLSPWKAPAVFGKEDFGGGAERTLQEVLKRCTDPEKTYILGGYSLAGLFALWAAQQTDVFAAVAAASPSVWFPGFAETVKEHGLRTGAVYLSLGDREEKTRNPVMATVGDRIRQIHAWLEERGTASVLEWNAGNHFQEADVRTARAFAWAMQQAAR